jgi:hypothetical protein
MRLVAMYDWRTREEVRRLSRAQFVTEYNFNYNNSLADHPIWSTIKTLPATLPEPSSMDRGTRFDGHCTLF